MPATLKYVPKKITRKQAVALLDALPEEQRQERVRFNATERETLLSLAVASSICKVAKDALANKAVLIPGLRRDMGLLAKLPERIIHRLYEIIPAEQLAQFRRSMQDTVYVTGCRKPGKQRDDDNFGVWVSMAQLQEMLVAIDEHCSLCDKDNFARKKCGLKKALDAIGVDVEHGDGCGYDTALAAGRDR